MSRIIVKSLPKSLTENELRNFFSEKGEITDIQLKYNNEGKFRCFAFVGFENEEQANTVKEYFNNTYLKNCKIKIEVCKNFKKQDENNNKEIEPKKKSIKEEFEDLKEDPEFLEFLKVQRNVGDTKKIWSDDVIMSAMAKKYLKKKEEGSDEEDDENEEKTQNKKQNKSKPDNIYQFTIAIRKIPQDQRNKKCIKAFFDPIKPISIRIPKIKCLAYVSFKNEKDLKIALEKHKSFMGNNQVQIQILKSKDSKDSNLEFNKRKNRIEKNIPFENIEENGRLFIRNLNYKCTVEDLDNLFKKYGPITEITLPIDQLSQKIKGFAFITFMFPEHAKNAFNELDRSTFQGRLLHIIPAECKDETNFDSNGQLSAFKKQKNQDLKKNSANGKNWNTLFLGQNAVANILSKKLNINKSEFFETNKNESLAARMALGETQLVNETRAFLEKNGVFLTSFDYENIQRSKTTFLIKHLPSNISEADLSNFLSSYGKIKKLILPPSCITAIVEMENQQVAYDMFKKLAYQKFKNIPLYLEWAPVNVFNKDLVSGNIMKENKPKKLKTLMYAVDEEETMETDQQNNSNVEHNINENIKEEEIEEVKEEEVEINKDLSYKILVKNIPFEATNKDLNQLFNAFGEIQFIRLPKKLKGTGSHRGFAFVEFVNKKDAIKAFKSLSLSTHLYGRRLVLEWAKTEKQSNEF